MTLGVCEGTLAKRRFNLVLIKPSHYDDDGYVIQWLRSAIPSNTLAVLNGLVADCVAREALGPDIEVVVSAFDETNTRIRPDRIARLIQRDGGLGLVALVGVQSNQFPHAVDIARPLCAAGIQVCMGGFHVSGCLAMLPKLPPDILAAQEIGISMFAGEAEGRLDEVLIDARDGALKPLYNYMSDLPPLPGVPTPILPQTQVMRTAGGITSFDAGRGCPFQCSFCTIINVQGRKSRRRSPDDVERIIRDNAAQGVYSFFITDDNLARNKDWEIIFDRLIWLRHDQKIPIRFVIQVDTLCHKIPGFIEKAAQAGVRRVFIGLENINPDNLMSVQKRQNRITEYRAMLLAWKAVGVITYAGYILGFPNDTRERILSDVEIVKRELPIDLLEFFFLTPLPGSADHKHLYERGAWMDSDMNKYDLEHPVANHEMMSADEWRAAYRDAWLAYYTPEHMETVMKRAVARGISPGKVMFLMLWFYGCITLENVHPLQGGYMRRKYRRDRRPSLPRESVLAFYPRYIADTVSKHARLFGLIWHFSRIRRRLKSDPEARNYVDQALTPVKDEDFDELEMFLHTEDAKSAVSASLKKTASAAARAPATA
jgi:hypothetical protein